jgi:DNA polymerase V
MTTSTLNFFKLRIGEERKDIPVFTGIVAGFPSPASDYLEDAIDLNEALIKNSGSTFFGRVKGKSMLDAGIDEGDIIIVDKSIIPKDGMTAVCYLDGDFTLKQIKIMDKTLMLLPANSNYKPIVITEHTDFVIWGIVTYVIKKLK